jgi:hypothetical protein
VDELIRWAAPLTAEENESLRLDSATSLDAHLGDAICQICAMVHFYVAVNEGLDWVEPRRLEYAESGGKRKCQRLAKCDQIELALFAPGGEGGRPSRYNPAFKQYCARINSAYGSPLREFPSRAILDGVNLARADLYLSTLGNVRLNSARLAGADLSEAKLSGADLSRASLDSADLTCANLASANLSHASLASASLDGASLYSARLKGADLRGARLNGADLRWTSGLTRVQIESAWIDERTALPEDLEMVKPEILERQRLRQERIEEIRTLSPSPEVEAPEEQ